MKLMSRPIRASIARRGNGSLVLRLKNPQGWLDIPVDKARNLLDEAHDRLDELEAQQNTENPS